MYAVIDNNQVKSEKASEYKDAGYQGIALSPYTYGEIILRPDQQRARRWLRKGFKIRYGLLVQHIFEDVSRRKCEDIPNLSPFAAAKDPCYTWLRNGMKKGPTEAEKQWARETKKDGRHFSVEMGEKAMEILEELQRGREDGQEIKSRFWDMEEALHELGNGPDSYLGRLVELPLQHFGVECRHCTDRQRLFDAIMQNQHLRHFFHGHFYYSLALAESWRRTRDNIKPSLGRDDWTDILLLLYTADGSRIVTQDKMVKQIVRMIAPTGEVTAGPVSGNCMD